MAENRNEKRIILFSKYPTPGLVKTRLIPILGPEGAAELQMWLLMHTLAAVRQCAAQCRAEIEVRYLGESHGRFGALLGNDLRYAAQGPGDLGARMNLALQDAFREGVSNAVLVGSDIPRLGRGILCDAFCALSTRDVVIGPAEDGGYYLIGMRRPYPRLFDDIPWSTEAVCRMTEEKLCGAAVSYETLETLADIDRPEDLFRWKGIFGAIDAQSLPTFAGHE